MLGENVTNTPEHISGMEHLNEVLVLATGFVGATATLVGAIVNLVKIFREPKK
jgi:hypothetical protein